MKRYSPHVAAMVVAALVLGTISGAHALTRGVRLHRRVSSMTAEDAPMPRHVVCLTFDFDTQSGHIARGLTTPTPGGRP